MEEDEDEGKEEERMEKEERNESGSSPKHGLSLQDLSDNFISKNYMTNLF